MTNKHGQEMIHRGPWQIAVKVTGCCCSDGVRRNVKLTGAPDTYFSIPAKVTIKGKTVTGFVSIGDDDEYVFHPTGKNKNILEPWPCKGHREVGLPWAPWCPDCNSECYDGSTTGSMNWPSWMGRKWSDVFYRGNGE